MRPGDLLRRFTSLDTRAQIALVLTFVACVAALGGLFWLYNRPSYTMVAAGMSPSESAKVVETLDKAGIPNQLENGGTAVGVPASQVSQARVALGAAGVSSGGSDPGLEIFNKNNLGATEFQQQVQYQRAMEGEIANSLRQVQGVSDAQVQLVLAQDQLFAEQSSKASASVLLELSQSGLDPGAVRGIAKLVQNSVQGLQPDAITITDQTGRLLWPQQGDGGGAGSVKQAAEAAYANQLSAGLNARLAAILGPGKADVMVNADLDMNRVRKEQLQYGPKPGLPLSDKTSTEALSGSGGAAGGNSGTGGNVPAYNAGGGGTSGNSNYRNTTKEQSLGVDKLVVRTEVAPGAVNRLQVAVLVDQGVPAAQVQAVQQAVSAAAGIQPARGDVLSVSQVPFVKRDAAPAPPSGPLAAPLGMVKIALASLGALLLILFLMRGLRRRDREVIEVNSQWMQDLEQPPARRSNPRPGPPPDIPQRPKTTAHQQVEQLADRDPEQLAEQVRFWMGSD